MLTSELCGYKLENPTILVSGILGVSGKLLVRVANNGAGAVTTKSITLEPRDGHPNPTILTGNDYIINAVGLSNPGASESVKEIGYAVQNSKSPVIASIAGRSIKDFGEVAKIISISNPHLIEVNISCPNVEDEFGRPFACSPVDAAKVTREVKKNTKIPIIVKLSPNIENIGEIAMAAEKAGADAIAAINTVGPKKNKFLANGKGGLSGPKIRKIALKKVNEIYHSVKVPIIGIGGITYGKDAYEMLRAGASCVGIGSAVYFRGIDVFSKVCDELKLEMKRRKIASIDMIKRI